MRGLSSAGSAKMRKRRATPLRRISLKSTALVEPVGALAAGEGFVHRHGRHASDLEDAARRKLRLAAYAGNGREDIVDGPLLPGTPYDPQFASFAQPSGLSSDGKRLFVADSEGSTVRSVPFDPNGKVETLVGLTGTLFDFGDIDGSGRDVRLQHPLDVAWAGGKLYVADTYNNKIKVIDVDQRTCHTLAGTGKPGMRKRRRALRRVSMSRRAFRRRVGSCMWRIRITM